MAETIEDRIRRMQSQGLLPAGTPVVPQEDATDPRPTMGMMPPASQTERGVDVDVREVNPELARHGDEARAANARNPNLDPATRPNLDPYNGFPIRTSPPGQPAKQEQGILPGEEQVTTADTLRTLPAPVQAGLRRVHAASGGGMDFEDWVGQHFGDMPPQQRAVAMQEAVPAAEPQPEQQAPPPRQPTPEQQANIAMRRQRQFARTIGNRYARMLTRQEEQYIDALAEHPNGMPLLRQLNEQLRSQYERDRHRDVGNRAANYNLSRDLRNPNYAPGMGVRSLIDAVRSGNSEMAGAVYDIYGNPVAGGQSRQLAGVKARALADQQAAQIAASNALQVASMKNGGDEQDPLKMERLRQELDAALAEPDPVRRHQSVRSVIAMNPANANMTAPEIEAETQRTIASHVARGDTPAGRDYAMRYLHSLKGNRDQFMSFAMYSLNMDEETAKEAYDEATKARTWEEFGRDWGHWAANAPAQAARAAGGAARGFSQGRAVPQ